MKKRKPIKPVNVVDPLERAYNKRTEKKTAAAHKTNRLIFIVCCMAAAATLLAIISLFVVFNQIIDLMKTRRDSSRLSAYEQDSPPDIAQAQADTDDYLIIEEYIDPFDVEMRGINPDYVCWINIEGTIIDYPVARALDNEKYLDLSFSGERNVFGALFMDYRCVGDYVPHIIIYGHNSRYKDMFGGLRYFTEEKYMKEHPIITLRVNGKRYNYKIFAARYTTVADKAYKLYFETPPDFDTFASDNGAPEGTPQILTLSTCVSGNDKDERVIVQGALMKGGA